MRSFVLCVLLVVPVVSYAATALKDATIAVYNRDRVHNEVKYFLAARTVSRMHAEKMQEAMEVLTTQLQQKRTAYELAVSKPGSEAAITAEMEYRLAEGRLDKSLKAASRQRSRIAGELNVQAFEKVRGILREYCVQQDIDLVLRTVGHSYMSKSAEDWVMEEAYFNVMYASSELDITDDFIAFANGRFAAEQMSREREAAEAATETADTANEDGATPIEVLPAPND